MWWRKRLFEALKIPFFRHVSGVVQKHFSSGFFDWSPNEAKYELTGIPSYFSCLSNWAISDLKRRFFMVNGAFMTWRDTCKDPGQTTPGLPLSSAWAEIWYHRYPQLRHISSCSTPPVLVCRQTQRCGPLYESPVFHEKLWFAFQQYHFSTKTIQVILADY